ncbi:hypothetical protein B0H11DRAFT_1907493 [Mycena galericulata]|nr:hypothetical protein B0H11DRAFT_1907493 [Mycena galericulata]
MVDYMMGYQISLTAVRFKGGPLIEMFLNVHAGRVSYILLTVPGLDVTGSPMMDIDNDDVEDKARSFRKHTAQMLGFIQGELALIDDENMEGKSLSFRKIADQDSRAEAALLFSELFWVPTVVSVSLHSRTLSSVSRVRARSDHPETSGSGSGCGVSNPVRSLVTSHTM